MRGRSGPFRTMDSVGGGMAGVYGSPRLEVRCCGCEPTVDSIP
jgi:hypothetical protein